MSKRCVDLFDTGVSGELRMQIFDGSGAFTNIKSINVGYNNKLNVSMDFIYLSGISIEYLYLTKTAIYENVDFGYISDYLFIGMDVTVRCVESECSGNSGGRIVSWDRLNSTCIGKDECRDTCYCITRYAAGLENYQDSGIETTIAIGGGIFIAFIVCFAFTGIVHCTTGFLQKTRCGICHNHDDFDFKAILRYCLQLWDFLSDLLLCLQCLIVGFKNHGIVLIKRCILCFFT